MKKNNALKPVLFAVLGLAVGILIGMSINGFPPQDNELAGSIGKVDNQRNVRITEADVQLRNDLAEDSARLLQYQRYLSYIYYKSLKSSADIERVISLIETNPEFIQSLNQTKTLEGFLTYLNTGRADLLTALQAVENPDMDNNVPIIQYLNDAQNAASHIQSNEAIFLSYMDDIETWLATHPDQNNQKLKEAHDLLAFNVLQTALIAQDKPMLKYLEDKKLCSDNQSLKTVLNDTVLKAEMLAFMEQDNAGIENFNAQGSQKIVKSMEQLNVVNSVFNNTLGAVNDKTRLGSRFTDMETMGGMIHKSNESLRLINDKQSLDGAFILDQPSLGAVVFDLQVIHSEALGCCPGGGAMSQWFN